LAISASERLLDAGSFTITGGVFDLNGFTETVGLLTLRGGSIMNGTLNSNGFNVEQGSVSTASRCCRRNDRCTGDASGAEYVYRRHGD
jgi:hypothetical protein